MVGTVLWNQPLPGGIGQCLQADRVRIELTCRTPRWCPRITWWLGKCPGIGPEMYIATCSIAKEAGKCSHYPNSMNLAKNKCLITMEMEENKYEGTIISHCHSRQPIVSFPWGVSRSVLS